MLLKNDGVVYLCPVCGYDKLRQPATNHMICPCCGIHFDYDDYAVSHDQLRQEWLDKGASWFSRKTTKPEGWNSEEQLKNLNALGE